MNHELRTKKQTQSKPTCSEPVEPILNEAFMLKQKYKSMKSAKSVVNLSWCLGALVAKEKNQV